MQLVRRSPLGLALLAGTLSGVTASCESEHMTIEGSTLDSIEENGSDGVTEGGSETVAACDGQTGVNVSGTVDFAGTVPSAARLWLFWRSSAGGIPPCSMEIKPVDFPSSFLFEQVPNQGWTLVAFIDVDGGFPPLPASGDYILETPAENLDLSSDVEELVLTIPSTPMP